MKKAFVEVVYSNSSGSMAGASCGILNRADVVEVEANDIQEAMKEAREKYKGHHFTTIKGINFLRWA